MASKSLSEFYTKDLNAQLLAYCTIRFPNAAWKLQPDLDTWRQFYVGDLACGEGTLLKALYSELKSVIVEQCTKVGIIPPLTAFHKLFVEKLCFGFDVVRETITTALEFISGFDTSLPNTRCNFFVLPLGKTPAIRLGSLDLLKTLFPNTSPQKITGSMVAADRKIRPEEPLRLPSFQVVLLNPPYARSCGDNLLFGTLPKRVREEMTRELRQVRKEIDTSGIGQAGQAADFIYLAQRLVAPGGRFAFVVPKSLCYGPSWTKVRQFLAKTVVIECLFFNYEYPHFGFSERTQLAECMVIARNKAPLLEKSLDTYTCTLLVNLLKSPANETEMKSLQEKLVELIGLSRELDKSSNYTTIRVPQHVLNDYSVNWAQVLGFYSPQLCRTHFQLVRDKAIVVPGVGQSLKLPLTPLQSLGTVGHDRKQVTENTIDGPGTAQILAVWGRNNRDFTTIQVQPTGYRHLKPKECSSQCLDFQQSASRLLLPETLWLETARVFSMYCTEPAISNVFWTFSACPDLKTRDGKPIAVVEVEQILALWGNSTLGILLFLGIRQETRGPWVHWKKKLMKIMLTLDPTQLTRDQITSLLSLCEEFFTRRPLHEATFMPAIVGGEKMVIDLPLLKILLEGARGDLPVDRLRLILEELYQFFANPYLNAVGLA